jgi:hypothetical protein
MANPPRKKGTKGEGEVLKKLVERGFIAKRTSSGTVYDIAVEGSTGRTINILATRPDNGQWLVTLKLDDLLHTMYAHDDTIHIEVKRFKRFSIHGIFESKFGKG